MSLRSFPPAAAKGVQVLVLGSMPGVESLRQQQYYAHPRNAFWPIMGKLFGFSPALPYEQRLEELNRAGVALWDSLAGCERSGSLDSNIREPVPNDIPGLLEQYPEIHAVFCNGTASYQFLKKYHGPLFGRSGLAIRQLPSTSPAAAVYSFEQKLKCWTAVKKAVSGIPSDSRVSMKRTRRQG